MSPRLAPREFELWETAMTFALIRARRFGVKSRVTRQRSRIVGHVWRVERAA